MVPAGKCLGPRHGTPPRVRVRPNRQLACSYQAAWTRQDRRRYPAPTATTRVPSSCTTCCVRPALPVRGGHRHTRRALSSLLAGPHRAAHLRDHARSGRGQGVPTLSGSAPRLSARGGMPAALPSRLRPNARGPLGKREAAPGGDPPVRRPDGVCASSIPGKGGLECVHSYAALQLIEALRVASPKLRRTTLSQLKEELEKQAAALKDDISYLCTLLAADFKRAI